MSSSGDSPSAAPTTPATLLAPNSTHNPNGSLGLGDEQISEDEARKRREQLNRRPSYRMILKDLETADKNLKKEPEDTPPASNEPPPLPLHVQIPPSARGLPGPSASPYDSPLGTSLLPPPSSTAIPHGLAFPLNGDLQPQLHLDYNPAALAAAVVAASQGRQLTPTSSQHELPGQGTPSGSAGLLLPGADLHGLKPPMGDLAANPFANHVGQNIIDWQQQLLSGYNSSPSPVSSRLGGPGGLGEDESTRKRQVRLLKNREAAKECRRKKKEYVKCLENRVAVRSRNSTVEKRNKRDCDSCNSSSLSAHIDRQGQSPCAMCTRPFTPIFPQIPLVYTKFLAFHTSIT
ncbi:unnamed protein product, partial [Mesorhabditis belari]|uniref:KID domain-containing protein n=1 Tax=Mesorhabditis belari TaxID=2138241 RepID=A0AAF3E9W3_9BILA